MLVLLVLLSLQQCAVPDAPAAVALQSQQGSRVRQQEQHSSTAPLNKHWLTCRQADRQADAPAPTWIVASSWPLARHHRRQLQSSEAVTRKLLLLIILLPVLPLVLLLSVLPLVLLLPPKAQSHRRAVWPQSTRQGCREASPAPTASALLPEMLLALVAASQSAPSAAAVAAAGGMRQRRSERSSLAEASRPPQGDRRTLQGHRKGLGW